MNSAMHGVVSSSRPRSFRRIASRLHCCNCDLRTVRGGNVSRRGYTTDLWSTAKQPQAFVRRISLMLHSTRWITQQLELGWARQRSRCVVAMELPCCYLAPFVTCESAGRQQPLCDDRATDGGGGLEFRNCAAIQSQDGMHVASIKAGASTGPGKPF